MSVGVQLTSEIVDSQLTTLAIQMRNIMQQVANLSTQVNSSDNGLAYLESIGYSGEANASNPGGVSDAAYALQCISYLNQPTGVYYGTIQAGGSGGTGAILFNVNSALSGLWAGQ